MNVETTLTDELNTVAASVQAPPPPAVSALVQEAEHVRALRTRRRLIASAGLAAAAVVAAIVLGAQLGKPSASPPPAPQPTVKPMSTGAPPRIPFVAGSKLYVDGRLRRGVWLEVVTAGRTSVATRGVGDGYSVPAVVLFRDGVEVAHFKADFGALLSPKGTKVAWLEVGDGTARVVVRDMDSGRDLGRLSVDRLLFVHDEGAEENEGWENLEKVADDGTVTYGGVVVMHTWQPGSAPVDHKPSPPGRDFQGYPGRAGYVWVGPDGTWGAWQTDRHGRSEPDAADQVNWKPDGITAQRSGEPTTRITFALPLGAQTQHVIWESSTDLLVVVSEDPAGEIARYLRCSITRRTCELAPTPTDP